ncbi:GMC oxidoreductase [Bdellovibrio sp. HCB209]|uniref:GMC oxidoreductase n=1 Tax=Bdellovibrio sp. HCB209 TaxID=3394354 RepID=UPI0039B411C6
MGDSREYDYIVIGSGFGGSVSALRLAEKGYKVAVLEMGRRWTPQNLPRSNWNLKSWLWLPFLRFRGFFSMRFFRHVVVLHGNAVGGGSITYANTLLVPPVSIWNRGSWAGLNDWQQVMPAHFKTVQKMLGVTTNKFLGPADLRLKQMADALGVGESFYPTEVGVFFGKENDPPGTIYEDPYFDGEGPQRKTCIGCGGCMVGCRHGAKNTLDLNYLYLAQKKGVEIFAETKVTQVKPLTGALDGSMGYEVTSSQGVQFKTRGVIFAASSLGTQELLLRLKEDGSLPRLSNTLGTQVRTNAESLIGVRYPGTKDDYSTGVAIGSGVYIDEHTHIEATRYPAGSNALSLITTVMTAGNPGISRIIHWFITLFKMLLLHPWRTLRTLIPYRWSQEVIIFLCMQTVDGTLTMKLKRPWYWPFMKKLTTHGPRIPTFIPAANNFAVKAAELTGGTPATSLTEIFLNIPMTAHCLGGAPMAATPDQGVVDGKQCVFGYKNMMICDGSVVSGNLGVNPSLTIAALAEHAMSFVSQATESHSETVLKS